MPVSLLIRPDFITFLIFPELALAYIGIYFFLIIVYTFFHMQVAIKILGTNCVYLKICENFIYNLAKYTLT